MLLSSLAVCFTSTGAVALRRSFSSHDNGAALQGWVREQLAQPKSALQPPIATAADGVTVCSRRVECMWLCATCGDDSNAAAVLSSLEEVERVFRAFLGTDCFSSETKLLSRRSKCLVLLEEMFDGGLPTEFDPDILSQLTGMAVTSRRSGGLRKSSSGKEASLPLSHQSASADGSLGGRPAGGASYKRNEVAILITERVMTTLAADGAVVSATLDGDLEFERCRLSGAPHCTIGLRDAMGDVTGVAPDATSQFSRPAGVVEAPALRFHPCVDLGVWNAGGIVAFQPPDRPFKLLSYTAAASAALMQPFAFHAAVTEHSRTRLAITLSGASLFEAPVEAASVWVTLPLPGNTSSVDRIAIDLGHAKRTAANTLVWRLNNVTAGQSFQCRAEVRRISTTTHDKAWVREPITIDCDVPGHIASGLGLKHFTVTDGRLQYATTHAVRYTTQATYTVRLGARFA